MEGWQKHYPGMIEWQDAKVHGGIKDVDAKTMTGQDRPRRDKAQPHQRHPGADGRQDRARRRPRQPNRLLPDQSGEHASTTDANIYVVGDACIAGDMPKSGFSANSQAKVAAMMVRGELANGRTFPARYTNTCWSLIETDDTVKVGGTLRPKDGKIAAVETFVSKTGETAELRKQTRQENMGWYQGIVADIWT